MIVQLILTSTIVIFLHEIHHIQLQFELTLLPYGAIRQQEIKKICFDLRIIRWKQQNGRWAKANDKCVQSKQQFQCHFIRNVEFNISKIHINYKTTKVLAYLHAIFPCFISSRGNWHCYETGIFYMKNTIETNVMQPPPPVAKNHLKREGVQLRRTRKKFRCKAVHLTVVLENNSSVVFYKSFMKVQKKLHYQHLKIAVSLFENGILYTLVNDKDNDHRKIIKFQDKLHKCNEVFYKTISKIFRKSNQIHAF